MPRAGRWKEIRMRVLLDDRAIEVDPETVERALEVGRARATAEGRIVIEVLGDGRSIEEGMLSDPPSDTGGFAELKLVSADPAAFVSVTLSDAVALLDDAASSQKEAADEVLAGRRESAFEPLQRALTAWGVARDVIEKSAMLLGIDLASVAVGEGTASAVVDGLAVRLGEIKRALTEQDDSALADVLAYDMPEQIGAWRGMFEAMQAAADGAGRGGRG